MASSLHVAGEHLGADVQRVLVLVCDQPALERQHLDALLEGASAIESGCAATVHGDALGVPAAVPPDWFESTTAAGDRGFRSRLGRQRVAGIFQLHAPELGTDIDRPTDLARARERGWLDG
jgi:molybdenum cofactor cytidylyltransferase